MKQKRPRIAYLIAQAQLCGGVAVVCQHANRLARRGFESCIVSTAGAEKIDWFPGQSVPVYPLSSMPSGMDIGVATWWETAHDLYRLSIPRKFYFVQSDETRFYPEGSHEKYFARNSYWFDFEFITEARWIQKWLKENFGKEARYVPNGIDPDIFHPAPALEPRGRKPRILIEGPADMPSKGVGEAFQVVSGLDCEVWYVNYRGEPDPAWKPDRYFYAVPMAEMKRIYSSCDILLKLSTVEGAPGPPLEMMACGGTCVVAGVTGIDEAIVPGENALVVEPGDIQAARGAVMRLILDKPLREKLVRCGRETAERLDWDKTIDALQEIYLSPALSDRKAPQKLLERRLHTQEAALVEGYRGINELLGRMNRLFREKVNEHDQIIREQDRVIGEQDLIIRAQNQDLAKKSSENQALRHEVDLKNDELNSIYFSKQWKIAEAFRAARRSFVDAVKLPFRIIRSIF
jgi:O-antigen biosynthesis protein